MHDRTPYQRGLEMLQTLTSTQRERTEAAINRVCIELAKLYGDRLPSLLTEHLKVLAVLHPRIIDAGHAMGPQSDEAFREVAKDIANSEPLVQRALDSADAQLKADIRAEKLAEMPPTVKMQMARDGALNSHLDAQVQAELDARHALRAA